MHVLILAGGLGTRIQTVAQGTPKLLMRIGKKPFVDHLMKYLVSQGIAEASFLLGWKNDAIVEHLKKYDKSPISINYIIETQPLGTGGAVQNAMRRLNSDEFLVLNGDTYFPIKLDYLVENTKNENAQIGVAVTDFKTPRWQKRERIGDEIPPELIRNAESNSNTGSRISGGIYYCRPKAVQLIKDAAQLHHFEQDFLFHQFKQLGFVSAFLFKELFFDFGTPETFAHANLIAASGDEF